MFKSSQRRFFGFLILIGLLTTLPAMARDPGELFPDVGFEGESVSDGSKTTDSAPPPPPKMDEEALPIAKPKHTPGKPEPTATPEPTAVPVPEAPAGPTATPVPQVPMPWFLTNAEAGVMLDKLAKDPKAGLEAAQTWAKTAKAAPHEKELVLGIGEYVSGSGPVASARFKRLTAGGNPTGTRAAVCLIAMIAKYPKGSYQDKPVAVPDVFNAACKELAGDLGAKARELLAQVEKINPDSLSQYNAAGGIIVRAKGLLSRADYISPSDDNEKVAREILNCEISVRRKGIDLILKRALKRKEMIDSIADPMVYYQSVGSVQDVWGPVPNATTINQYVTAMLRDKKRADELLTQLKTLQEKARINDDLTELTKQVNEADCITVPKGTGKRDKWFNLGRMFGAIDRNAKSPGNGFTETKEDKTVQVKAIRVMPRL